MTTKKADELPEEAIRKLSEILKSTDLAEIEVSNEGFSIRVRAKDVQLVSSPVAPAPVAAAQGAASSEESAEAGLHIVRSPFVGTFYRAASPTSAPYVDDGQNISKSQVLCIVEAMKVMNEIESEVSGKVEKVFVENGAPVEFNAPLFGIRT